MHGFIAHRGASVLARSVAALVLLLTLSGCLAPYDQMSDQQISTIHQQFDAHVDAVAPAGAGGAAQPVDGAFYTKLRGEIRALRLRTEARGEDSSLISQAKLLDELLLQVDKAEQLEKSGLQGTAAWQTVKDGLSTNFKGFLTSELARKPKN